MQSIESLTEDQLIESWLEATDGLVDHVAGVAARLGLDERLVLDALFESLRDVRESRRRKIGSPTE